jgi:hypothetical protein
MTKHACNTREALPLKYWSLSDNDQHWPKYEMLITKNIVSCDGI